MTDVDLIEDDTAVAASIAALLESWGYGCTGFGTGEAFLRSHKAPAACILLDARLPGIDGLDVLKAFRERDGQTPVIMISGHGDIDMAVEAMQLGAQDFVEKPFDGDELIEKINLAIDKSLPAIQCRQRIQRLTPRETDVLQEIVAGHPNKIIANNLGISPKTVEMHRGRVMDKTEASSVPQLIRIALRGGIKDGSPV